MSSPGAPAIEVDHVAKRFRRYLLRNQSVKAALFRGGRARFEENWVLDDVTFDIPSGTTFGLIGSNGSGKSTLLKCMARILRPDRGEIRVNGRLSALIELGAGFHPELTGRENVYLNGAVLGLKRREIDARFDEIIDFSGRQVAEAIDAPIKTYSSGMYVRLGFSIAVNVEPEVLLVDEVLAVGDEEFQRRCHQRFEDLSSAGRTVVVVSHALGTVAAMCDQVAWLEGGKLAHIGPPQQSVDAYLTRLDFGEAAMAADADLADVRITDVSIEPGPQAPDSAAAENTANTANTGERGRPDNPVVVRGGQAVVMRLAFETDEAMPTPLFAFSVHTLDGRLAANPSTLAVAAAEKVQQTGWVELHIPKLMLVDGSYTLGAALIDAHGEHAIDKKLRFVHFEVQGGDAGDRRGIASLGGSWTGTPIEPTTPAPE